MKIYQYNNYRPNFKATFLHSESLKQIVEYSIEHKKFDKLNQARKNIGKTYLKTRLRVDVGENEKGFPYMSVARFVPKKNVLVAMTSDDYYIEKIILFESSKKQNIWDFAMQKLIKMGNDVPKNRIFQNIVVKK